MEKSKNTPATYEAFLQKWFGLVGPIWKSDKTIRKHEGDGDFHPFTKSADKAWFKCTELVDDLVSIGALDQWEADNIKERFCDLA